VNARGETFARFAFAYRGCTRVVTTKELSLMTKTLPAVVLSKIRRSAALLLGLVFLGSSVNAAGLDRSVEQLIVSISPGWDSTQGKLQLFERNGTGWKPVGEPWAVLYGPKGLAWGRGVFGTNEAGLRKVERDKRAPAGVFKIGKIYTYDSALPPGADYPFHTVGKGDAWIDDVNHPDYNKHVVVDPKNPPPWFAKQKMRHNDFAYRWLVEIRHNSDPPIAGQGSAIFFHIRRGPTRPSAGCTVMAEANLVRMIRWLRADRNPHYALLTREDYLNKWRECGLPSPEQATAVMPSSD
jgi:L,D-peptidoglycan transpeptidase YkuD (ErfK/YbiS/YcfS/YnhG family)